MTEFNVSKKRTAIDGWFYKLILFVSFLWVSTYTAASTVVTNFQFDFGNLFDLTSPNFSYIVLMLVIEALVSWLFFELLFFLYRYVMAYSIYSFVVPMDRLKTESRLFFTYRNVIYGIFINLCFFVPYLHSWLPFLSIVISLTMVLLFALHINKAYAEPIIGHFVFKSFVYPVFIFEIFTLAWQVVEVLL